MVRIALKAPNEPSHRFRSTLFGPFRATFVRFAVPREAAGDTYTPAV